MLLHHLKCLGVQGNYIESLGGDLACFHVKTHGLRVNCNVWLSNYRKSSCIATIAIVRHVQLTESTLYRNP